MMTGISDLGFKISDLEFWISDLDLEKRWTRIARMTTQQRNQIGENSCDSCLWTRNFGFYDLGLMICGGLGKAAPKIILNNGYGNLHFPDSFG